MTLKEKRIMKALVSIAKRSCINDGCQSNNSTYIPDFQQRKCPCALLIKRAEKMVGKVNTSYGEWDCIDVRD